MPESSSLLPQATSPRLSISQMFSMYADGIYNFCRRFTGSQATAEDLTQEVFVRAIRYADSFEGRSSASTWLYSIASNVCRDHSQQAGRRLYLVEPHALEELAGADAAQAPRELSEKEASGKLNEALEQLTELQREVLILSRYHGKTYAEISEITGQTVNAIKQMVFRAMARLRELLETTMDGRFDDAL